MKIKDFTDSYATSEIIRAHMPGHKGHNGCEYDITEITGADSLFEADGIIAESERATADIFGSYKTLYSAGGSTLCIQTMLTLCVKASGCKKIVAARNCHRAFINTCALLDLEVEWIYPEYESSIVSGRITAQAVRNALEKAGEAACVYITSPDYLGKMAPLDQISAVCREKGVFLAVDNAHGAYLRFVDNAHPLAHGADICCDSAHKTLPVLTGGAYLHINNPSPEIYEGCAKETMSMYGSSSPSYLILRSLDCCVDYMRESAAADFTRMKEQVRSIKEELSPFWRFEGDEWGKLTVYTPPAGMHGYELAERLRERDIECEYADNTHCVLMVTGLYEEELEKIRQAFKTIPQPRIMIRPDNYSGFIPLERAMSIREASFAPCEKIPADNAAGRICANTVTCCPPGIAAVVSGEKINEDMIKILKNYSIFDVNVVK